LAIRDRLDTDARLDRYQPLRAAQAERRRRAGDAAGGDASYAEAITWYHQRMFDWLDETRGRESPR
jgi:predicted RNA polymerase sigma factor